MKITWLFIILFGTMLAEQTLAQSVALPPIFGDVAVERTAVKAILSPDKGGALIAIRVQANEKISPFAFYDAGLWERQVYVKPFMPEPSASMVVQYASMFCALNSTVEGACASKELTGVSTSEPWWIPVATARAEYVEATIASITDTHPSASPAVPMSTPRVSGRDTPRKPPTQKIIWDDVPAPNTVGIMWD